MSYSQPQTPADIPLYLCWSMFKPERKQVTEVKEEHYSCNMGNDIACFVTMSPLCVQRKWITSSRLASLILKWIAKGPGTYSEFALGLLFEFWLNELLHVIVLVDRGHWRQNRDPYFPPLWLIKKGSNFFPPLKPLHYICRMPHPPGTDLQSVHVRRNIPHSVRLTYHESETAKAPDSGFGLHSCDSISTGSPPQVPSVNNSPHLISEGGQEQALPQGSALQVCQRDKEISFPMVADVK